MEKMKMQSKDKAKDNFEKLVELFPNAVTEVVKEYDENGKPVIERMIDKDILMQEIAATIIDEKEERYQFTWPDKKKAILTANAPINKTLRPCKEESVNFNTTENIYIEGDNLDVLKLLHETYLGKVKMIYIDPPYNTGNDFVYEDNFAQDVDFYIKNSGQLDDEGNKLIQNSESNGRFHTDWLNMIYPRIKLAKDLLRDDGIIFISIDDNEIGNVIKICDEIFGQEQYLACFPRVTKKAGKTTDAIAKNHDYLLAYGKTSSPLFFLPDHTDDGFKYTDEFENERGKYKLNQTLDYNSLQYSSSLDYPIEIEGETIYPGQSFEEYLERKKGNHARADWAWRWSKELFDFGYKNGFVVVKKYDSYSRIYTKTYQNAIIVKSGSGFEIEYKKRTKAISTLEFIDNEYSNDNSKKNIVQLFGKSVFDYSKPVSLLSKLCQYTTEKDDLILDFFSGSSTTAQAVIELNAVDQGKRKFIMIQLPEECPVGSDAYKAGYRTICDIGKDRIRLVCKNQDESDVGFRVLKIDSSNMKDVYYNSSEFNQEALFSLAENIKPDRTPEDLLFQVMLDLGVLLSSKIKEEVIAEKSVFSVADGFLIACFDSDVTVETVTEIAKRHPRYAVFRDSGMATDSVATNFDQIFATYSPNTVRRIL